MPELPDIELYLQALKTRIYGEELTAIELHTPFFLRTVEPPPSALLNRKVTELRRIGKRIAVGYDDAKTRRRTRPPAIQRHPHHPRALDSQSVRGGR